MVFSSELELRGCVLHYDPARQELCLVAEDPLGSRKRPLEKEQTLPQQTHKKREVTEESDDDRMPAPKTITISSASEKAKNESVTIDGIV